MEEIKLAVASNLIRLRTAAGMTQFELGQLLNYTDKAVSKWERAESLPDIFVLKKIADIFGVSVDYIISPHDEWEKTPAKLEERKFRPAIVATITAAGIFTVAVILFVIFWILGSIEWSIFVYAVPVTAVTMLVFNSVWNGGKGNVVLVSLLVISIIAALYTMLYRINHVNLCQCFIIAIPAELIVVLSFHVLKRNKDK